MAESKQAAEDSQRANQSLAPARTSSAAGRSAAIIILLLVGALAGALGSQAVYQVRELLHIAPERLGMPPHPPRIEREMLMYAIANHAIGFGCLGLLICGGIAAGLAAMARSPGAALWSLLIGGVLGLACGAAGGAAAHVTYESLVFVEMDGLFKAILIHLPNWLLLAVATAAAAASLRLPGVRLQQIFVSAFVAAGVAALLYPLLGLVLFTAAASDRPIPSPLGLRVLCFALGGAILGIAAARWLPSPSPARGAS